MFLCERGIYIFSILKVILLKRMYYPVFFFKFGTIGSNVTDFGKLQSKDDVKVLVVALYAPYSHISNV